MTNENNDSVLLRIDEVFQKIKRNISIQAFRYSMHRFPRLRSIFHILRSFRNGGAIFSDRYQPEDNGITTLFTNQDTLFPDYPHRKNLFIGKNQINVALISTIKNEVSSIDGWFTGIWGQTRLPDEIIIVDGGSTDGSYEKLLSIAHSKGSVITVLQEPGANIARGRNIAIQHSRSEYIVATDFGCRFDPNWFENLIAPFTQDPSIETVAGWYQPVDPDGNLLKRRIWPRIEFVEPGSFVPSSRSIAFTKKAWEKVLGYPEWLTLTGEDTYFGLELQRFCSHRAFVPDAVVQWLAPLTWKGYLQKTFQWAIGDGEIGLNGGLYWRSARLSILGGAGFLLALVFLLFSLFYPNLILLLFTSAIYLAVVVMTIWFCRKLKVNPFGLVQEFGAMSAQALGFLKGYQTRGAATQRRYSRVKGIYFILAGVPLNDTGGGSRGAQITFELLRQNYVVIYIHKYDSYESKDLGLRYRHPNLIEFSLDQFAWEKVEREIKPCLNDLPIRALIEFPLPDFLSILEKLHSLPAVIGYDLLDAWNTQLGSSWFSQETESKIISFSDHLIATAPSLVSYLEEKTARPVHFLPNAVNSRLFSPLKTYRRPSDLPPGGFTITYIGALWGDWFDWDLLSNVAASYPQASVIVIGDYRDQCAHPHPNLHFLGLKPQRDLPAYLAYTQVAIIPWKENEITHATSPLKLYEYLAMRVPVVTPDLPVLGGIPYVYRSANAAEFIRNIEKARGIQVDETVIGNYIQQHCWEYRVQQLTDLLK